MKKLCGALGALFLLGACSHFPKPGPARKAEPVLSRGWNFVETERELLSLDAGVDPVSFSSPVLSGEKLFFGS